MSSSGGCNSGRCLIRPRRPRRHHLFPVPPHDARQETALVPDLLCPFAVPKQPQNRHPVGFGKRRQGLELVAAGCDVEGKKSMEMEILAWVLGIARGGYDGAEVWRDRG